MNSEGLLTQFGYSANESLLAQMQRIVKNTKDFDKIQKHIIQLNDTLKPHNSYIAMSNSNDYLKIKLESTNQDEIDEVTQIIKKWALKYKVGLKKVENKNTWYILGFEL